jgi:hypothetical protein
MLLPIQHDLPIQSDSRWRDPSDFRLQNSATLTKLRSLVRDESLVSVDSSCDSKPREGEQVLEMAVLLDQQHTESTMSGGSELFCDVGP